MRHAGAVAATRLSDRAGYEDANDAFLRPDPAFTNRRRSKTERASRFSRWKTHLLPAPFVRCRIHEAISPAVVRHDSKWGLLPHWRTCRLQRRIDRAAHRRAAPTGAELKFDESTTNLFNKGISERFKWYLTLWAAKTNLRFVNTNQEVVFLSLQL